jgi:hypothetical protein
MNAPVEKDNWGSIIESRIFRPRCADSPVRGREGEAMRELKAMIPAVLLGAGMLLCVTSLHATQEYAKKEKKGCTTCHGKVEAKEAMPKNLNATGKYYHEKKTLEGAPTEKK